MDTRQFERNNLDRAASPYLKQHADNPVWWQEWQPEVLAYAKENGKPVLLSVGYATCHWCHVMAAEVFSDPTAAAALNAAFVAIKIDRQERPDIDRWAMDFMVRNYGQGGWPLNVFMTAAGAPFAAATYIPLRPAHGQPGFVSYLDRVMEFYGQHGDSIPAYGLGWSGKADTAPIVMQERNGKALLDDPVIAQHLATYQAALDANWGGFGEGQKFPPHSSLLFLVQLASVMEGTELDSIRDLISNTLDQMRSGGLHDHLQGGFFRYCTDSSWTIPHFEKMLYDQAQLLWTYALAARVWDRPDYAATARGVLRCLRESFLEDGLFISGLDADTNHHEGATYLWHLAEIEGIVGPEGLERLRGEFHLSEGGNFEGLNHLILRNRRPAPTADSTCITELERRTDGDRGLLLAARRLRPQPTRDSLIVTGWNALAGIALVQAWRLLDDRQALEEAQDLFDRLLALHYKDGHLARSSLGVHCNNTQYLEDASALLLLAGYLHEEDQSRGTIMEELKTLVLSFKTAKGWLESRNADFFEIPAAGFDSPLPSSASLAEAALVRADLVLVGTYRPCAPGLPLRNDFQSWAWLHAQGILPVAGTPEVQKWSALPLGAVQHQADASSICRLGRCEFGAATGPQPGY